MNESNRYMTKTQIVGREAMPSNNTLSCYCHEES